MAFQLVVFYFNMQIMLHNLLFNYRTEMSDLAMIPFIKSVWNRPITSIILHYKTMGPFSESGEVLGSSLNVARPSVLLC